MTVSMHVEETSAQIQQTKTVTTQERGFFTDEPVAQGAIVDGTGAVLSGSNLPGYLT